MTAVAHPTVVGAGHELALLAFVEQELARLAARRVPGDETLTVLQAAFRSRRRQLYQRLLDHFAQRNDWAAALRIGRALLRRTPGDVAAHSFLGMLALRQGQRAEAQHWLGQAALLGSRSPEVYGQLAELYASEAASLAELLALRAASTIAVDTPAAPAYADRAEQLVAQTQASAALAVRPQPHRTLSDTPERLHYWSQLLDSIRPEARPSASALAELRRDLAARQAVLAPAVVEPQAVPSSPADNQANAQGAAPPAASQPSGPQAPPTAPLKPARPAINWEQFWGALFSERMLRTLLYLGAILLVASACIWMAFNWGRFAAPVQLAALVGITATFYGTGALVRSKLGLRRSGITLIAIGGGWVAADGWALANPGLLDLAMLPTWLLISALCLVVYVATAWWLREELFSAMSGLAAVSLLLAGLQNAQVGLAWQSSALLLLLIGFLLLARWLRRLPEGDALAAPLHWLAQVLVPVTLIGASFLLHASPHGSERTLLALDWWLAAGFYLLALRLNERIGYEQALTWSLPAALLFSGAALGLPDSWGGTLMLVVTPAYLWIAPRRRAVYAASTRPWLNYPATWPVYSTSYALSLLALFWPSGTTAALAAGALAVTALYGVSAWLFRRPIWSWVACAAGLVAAARLFGLLAATASPSNLVLCIVLTGVVYWAAGELLARWPAYAAAPKVIGWALLLLAALGCLLVNPATRQLVLMIEVLVLLAGAWLNWRRMRTAPQPRPLQAAAQLQICLAALLLPLTLNPPHPLVLCLLAATYIVFAWGLPLINLAGTRSALLGLAVALTLAALGTAAGQPDLPLLGALLLGLGCGWYSAVLVATPARPAASSWPATPLDWGGLAVGLGGWLVAVGGWGQPSTLLPVLLAAMGVYGLAAVLHRLPAALYAALGLLLGALIAGLSWLGVPLVAQGAWLAPAALLLVAPALWAGPRQPRWAPPLRLYGYGSAVLCGLWCVAAYASGQLAPVQNGQGAVALAGLAVLAVISRLTRGRSIDALLAAALPPLSYLLALAARQVPLDRYGPAFGGLALVYLALVLLHAQGWLAGLRRFLPVLLWAGNALVALALLLSLLSGSLALGQVCVLFALAYAVAALVLRRPGFVGVAALLLPAGVTLLFAAVIEPLLGTLSLRGPLWLALAWLLMALGLWLRSRVEPAFRAPLHTVGLALAACAPLWTVDERPVLLVTLGLLLLLCLRWCVLALRDVPLVVLGVGAGRLTVRQLASEALLYPLALLAPLWVLLLCDTLGLPTDWLALVLALLAPLWLGLARWLASPARARPFLWVCYGLTLVAPLVGFGLGPVTVLALNVALYVWVSRRTLASARWVGLLALGLSAALVIEFAVAWGDWPVVSPWMWFGLLMAVLLVCLAGRRWVRLLPLALMVPLVLMGHVLVFGEPTAWAPALSSPVAVPVLLLAVAVYAALARLYRQPAWVIPAALTMPATLMLLVAQIAEADLLRTPGGLLWLFDLALGGPALAGLALAWWLDRRQAGGHAVAGLPLPRSPFSQPIYVTAVVANLMTLGLALWPSTGAPSGWPMVVAGGTAVLFWSLMAWRFRQPALLYLASVAGGLAYRGLLLLVVLPDSDWLGLLVLPGVWLAFLGGVWLHRRRWSATPPPEPLLFDPQSGIAWATPLYLWSFGGALCAVGLSSGNPLALLLSLLSATALLGLSAWLWRSRVWLAAALLVGQLAYAVLPAALGWRLSQDDWALLLLPLAWGLALAGLWVERRRGAPAWARLVYLFAAADVLLAVLLPRTAMGGVGAALGGAALLALFGSVWRERVTALLALVLLALAGDWALRGQLLGTEIRCAALATQGLVAWWLGQALHWRGTGTLAYTWADALRRWGLLASGLAVVLAFHPLVVLGDRLPLSWALAVVGLLCVGLAAVERRLRLSYLGSALLVAAWYLLAPSAQPQFYAIPAGIYLLALGAAERWQGSPRRLVQLLELLGMCVLLVVSFGQSLPDHFGYGVLVFFEALLVIFWGVLQRVRLLFFGGVFAFLLNLVVLSLGPIQAMDKSLLAFGVGLVLVIAAVYVERRRDVLLSRAQHLLAQLEQWS